MTTANIASLQQKYPGKIPVALDSRAFIPYSLSSTKDFHRSEPAARVRKPRSRDTVELSEFDNEMEMFLCVEDKTLYYMPSSQVQYCTYMTRVAATGASTYDFVSEIVETALRQSLREQGSMRGWETRIFWVSNESSVDTYPLIHTTVVRENNEYRVVAEIGRSESHSYTSIFSIKLPLETF